MVPKKNKNFLAVPDGFNALSKKMVLFLCVAAFLLLAGFLLPHEVGSPVLSASLLPVDMTGFASLGCAYLLAILLLAPLSPFALTAGGLFGFWWGTALALLALNAGAALAFFIARYLLPRRLVSRLQDGGRVALVVRAMAGSGIGTIALLRLNPMVPFNLQNYVCGATGVNFARYSMGTLIGAAPCTVALVYLGHAGRRLFVETGLQVEQWSLLIFLTAAVLTVPPTVLVLRRTVKRLRECRTNDETTANRKSTDER